MAMDGVGPSPGVSSPAGFMGQMSRRSIVQPQGTDPLAFNGAPILGATLGATRGVSDTFQDNTLAQQWGSTALRWSGREAFASALNNAMGAQQAPVKPAKTDTLKQKFSKNARAAAAASSVKTYSHWFNLGTETVELKGLTMAKYKETVRNNLKNSRPFSPEALKKLGQVETWKEYVRKTLIKANVKPLEDLLTNKPEKNWGAGLSRLFALGFSGFDVLKNTKETYDQTHDATETAIAAAKYTLRAAATWELAGVGMAVGRAVLPLAVCSIPLGGILVGALFAALGQKALDPLLNTGDCDPNRKKEAVQETSSEAPT
jgi:hypothetical protein